MPQASPSQSIHDKSCDENGIAHVLKFIDVTKNVPAHLDEWELDDIN